MEKVRGLKSKASRIFREKSEDNGEERDNTLSSAPPPPRAQIPVTDEEERNLQKGLLGIHFDPPPTPKKAKVKERSRHTSPVEEKVGDGDKVSKSKSGFARLRSKSSQLFRTKSSSNISPSGDDEDIPPVPPLPTNLPPAVPLRSPLRQAKETKSAKSSLSSSIPSTLSSDSSSRSRKQSLSSPSLTTDDKPQSPTFLDTALGRFVKPTEPAPPRPKRPAGFDYDIANFKHDKTLRSVLPAASVGPRTKSGSSNSSATGNVSIKGNVSGPDFPSSSRSPYIPPRSGYSSPHAYSNRQPQAQLNAPKTFQPGPYGNPKPPSTPAKSKTKTGGTWPPKFPELRGPDWSYDYTQTHDGGYGYGQAFSQEQPSPYPLPLFASPTSPRHRALSNTTTTSTRVLPPSSPPPTFPLPPPPPRRHLPGQASCPSPTPSASSERTIVPARAGTPLRTNKPLPADPGFGIPPPLPPKSAPPVPPKDGARAPPKNTLLIRDQQGTAMEQYDPSQEGKWVLEKGVGRGAGGAPEESGSLWRWRGGGWKFVKDV